MLLFGHHYSATLLFLLATTYGHKGSDAHLSYYSNITLKSNNGDLSAVIYLPQGIKPGEPTYYMSTRFDHGSMIGEITRTTRNADDKTEKKHVLYGNQQWRVPHDPYWPESGIGLASEFGVGDDGAFCNYRCGWYQINEVTNGILGYPDAKVGGSFLKIGVGELIKGSCIACDSTEDFKFNSPYEFAKTPVWTLEDKRLLTDEDSSNTIVLENEAILDPSGYNLKKEITLNDDELLVKSTLTNMGREPFATAWYSHHFFTCDAKPVGNGYGLDLDLTGTGGTYEEPGSWFWSTPLRRYSQLSSTKDNVAVDMQRGVERDVRIKAEFDKDDQTHGGFTIRGCGTSIKETIPEVGTEGGVSMYAFNLYIETGTFSPEPQIYMHLWPGQSISWTQKLEFGDIIETETPNGGDKSASPNSYFGLKTIVSISGGGLRNGSSDFTFVIFALSAAFLSYSVHFLWRRRRRQIYSPIPDHQ
jgi:hypothetical protein